MAQQTKAPEKKVRWSDRGEWCDRCGEAKAAWSGLCETCHALPRAPENGIAVGGYTIRPFSDGNWMIENAIGEGMQVKGPILEKLIGDFFAKNF